MLPLSRLLLLFVSAIAVALTIVPGAPSTAQPKLAYLELKSGDRIAIVGNALAERMQHEGWLETNLYERFPKADLVVRNLGFAGDELSKQTRSTNFGSTEAWLKKTEANVVFAFFGYNESYAGERGLPKFRGDLDAFVKKHQGRRVVLFSPIAHENLRDPNLPDGAANNARLKMYTAEMAEVAKENGVPFVDLFAPTLAAYAKVKTPLTINGVHLNDLGNEVVAQIIDRALFNPTNGKVDIAKRDKIRQAVKDKNFYWFNRYRTIDGYNIYGGRSGLSYTGGITNKTVFEREMQILDVMTANRDRRIWALAKGGDLKVDDANTPPFIEVKSNRTGSGPDGKFVYLDGDDAIKKMTIGKGLKINCFASEKDFPELANPVQMAFDNQGRLWVATWPDYPHWKPKSEMSDKILIFEDTKGTGKADKMTVFADKLNAPTGFAFHDGGVIVAQSPYLLFLKDTEGKGKANVREHLLSTLDSADSHHSSNSFTFGPDGWLYFQEGTFHHSSVETPWGPTVRTGGREGAGAYRFNPRTHQFEIYTNVDYANPHGHGFDRWGQDILIDGTNAIPYDAALVSVQTEGALRHKRNQLPVYSKKTRPCSGLEILSSRHFPESWQQNLLVANVIGFQGILRYKIANQGAALVGTEQDFIVRSSDPNFRPADLKTGPDGALYFADWQNPLIGHMQHHLRDPNRNHTHGRLYRVTHEDRPLLKPTKIAGEPIDKLLDVLKSPENLAREHARRELASRKTSDVLTALDTWWRNLDRKDPDYEHHVTEALWMHQTHNVVNEFLLKRVLRSPDFLARAAATRVLGDGGTRVPGHLELLRTQVNDAHPRVRLHAVRALSFLKGEAPIAVALEAMAHPTDKQINFVFNATLNTLEARLGGGAGVDRKNIAGSLLNLLEKGSLDHERKAALIETISRNGSTKELTAIWKKVLEPKTYPSPLRGQTMDWLAEAATARGVKPLVEPTEVASLLKDLEPGLLSEALRLAAAFKATEVAVDFQRMAQDARAPLQIRYAAMDGLVALNDPASAKLLRELTGDKQPLTIRYHASAGLSGLDLDAAALTAAAALTRPDPDADPGQLIQAFLSRKGGPEKLGAALEKQTLAEDTAKRLLRSMFLAGHSEPSLMKVISKFAGLEAVPKAITPAYVQEIAKEAAAKGDAARGEKIFRRADLGCVTCHAVNKAGGNIGPDLGPVGAANALDFVITSILDPNASIKEEYLTKVITTTKGQIFTGIVIERNKSLVVLKESTGKIARVPVADIDEEAPGKSLMPDGITRLLTYGELVDLSRFVSELGKPGPYAIPTAMTVRRWRRLKTVSPALRNSVPDLEELRGILATDALGWTTHYGQVNGQLPLGELAKAGQSDVVYLQGDVQVTQAGPIEILVESSAPIAVWIGEQRHEKPAKLMVNLPPGRHTITVRVEIGTAGPPSTLRLELRKPADSSARFEILNGGE